MLKKFSYVLIAVIITIGICIAGQAIWAAWTAPIENPPEGNVELPISRDAQGNVIIQLGS